VDKLSIHGTRMTLLTGPEKPFLESMQTDHDYRADVRYEIMLKTPLRVGEALPNLYFEDLAIVEPENDFVIVEATRNGLDWIEVDKYDARYHVAWRNAFENGLVGDNGMSAKHTVDIGTHFNSGEVLFFRFRLLSNQTVTGWGWSIDYISFQEEPTATEPPIISSIGIYPNPTSRSVTVDYFLTQQGEVQADVTDMFGRKVVTIEPHFNKPGKHQLTIDLTGKESGNYLIMLKAGNQKTVKKIIVRH
jgi:hypothetical protein